MPAGETPRAELVVDVARARTLLESQHPDLADRGVEFYDEGWDNVMFRVGTDLALRLPRRDAAADLIRNEQRWLPALAPLLPIDAPCPVRLGRPEGDYPYAWSVIPWINGCTADEEPPGSAEAERLGAFLAALHQPAPPDAPRSMVRGVPLEARRAATEERLDRLEAETDAIDAGIRRFWLEALDAGVEEHDTWLHGDLHPRNMIVGGGTIRAVIDWGDVCVGDRATDLAAAWMLFADRVDREAVLTAAGGITAGRLARARGWAVFFGAVLLDTGRVDHPAHARIGEQTLRRLSEDARAT